MIFKKTCRTDIANHSAVLEGIAAVTGNARASRSMVNDLTLGELSASTGARILTFGLYASLGGYAIRVDNAFRPTSFVRIADVIEQARTRSRAVLFLANGVKTAW